MAGGGDFMEINYWWVNQNQTYQYEIRNGYMWSPKTNSNGARNQFYDNMKEAKPGDIVFSFKDTFIKALGIVTGTAQSRTKPLEFISVDNTWNNEGWYVPVEFQELNKQLHPKSFISLIRPTLPDKYSPLQSNGNGIQSVYLASVPFDMARVIRDLLDGQVESFIENDIAQEIIRETENESHEQEIRKSSDVSDTEKIQIIKARRGQGIFKKNVQEIEKNCRVTKISDINHLRASHIKPWSKSSHFEKLDGNNGLLLSPHVDHLFDRGYVSFIQNGSILISPKIKKEILYAWGIDPNSKSKMFTPEQEHYLEFHRDEIFKKQ